MAPKVSLTIVSNEIVFSITEMGFIKKHLHWKYPTAMGDLIDSTRVLMREVQKLSRPDCKLTYTASRYHPNDDARFVVYELLGHELNGHKSLIALQPLEPARRAQFRATAANPFMTVDEVAQQLSNGTKDKSLANHSSPGGLHAPFVIQAILNYLSAVTPHVVIQSFSLASDSANNVSLGLDLGHTQSISHYVRLSFDFTTSKSTNESSA